MQTKRLLSFLCSTLFVANILAVPTGYVHRVYQCPNADQYHQYLLSGKPIRQCPINDATNLPEKNCSHRLRMQPMLDSYGGFAPTKFFKVIEEHGYFHHQCHYTVQVGNGTKVKKMDGHFLIDGHHGENCYRSSSQKNDVTFYCELPLYQQGEFQDNGRRL